MVRPGEERVGAEAIDLAAVRLSLARVFRGGCQQQTQPTRPSGDSVQKVAAQPVSATPIQTPDP